MAISSFEFLVLLLELIIKNAKQQIVSEITTIATLITVRFSNIWPETTLPILTTPAVVNIDFIFLAASSSLSLKWCRLNKIRNLQCSKYTWNYSFWQYEYSIFGNVFNFLIFWRNVKFISRKFSIYFQFKTITPVAKLGQFCCNFRLTNRFIDTSYWRCQNV